jgi:hypothetical protein
MRNRVMNFIGKANYTGDLGTYIWSNNEAGKTELIAIVEGYREIQNICTTISEANEFQDEMGRFIAEAINEKIQRESSVKIKRIIASDLDISIRLLRLFNRMDITYLDEISKLTRGEVNYLRNFGTKTKFELEQLMIENNLKFKGE